MDRLLTRRVPVSVNGQAKQVSGLEAIVLQLMQKEMAGDARAGRILLKYQADCAESRAERIPRWRLPS